MVAMTKDIRPGDVWVENDGDVCFIIGRFAEFDHEDVYGAKNTAYEVVAYYPASDYESGYGDEVVGTIRSARNLAYLEYRQEETFVEAISPVEDPEYGDWLEEQLCDCGECYDSDDPWAGVALETPNPLEIQDKINRVWVQTENNLLVGRFDSSKLLVDIDVKDPNNGFVTKDSGEREVRPSGYQRDTQKGKPRFSLMWPHNIPYEFQMMTRFAQLLARGAEKYDERNWERADDVESLERFKDSAERHLHQWLTGEIDEDHAAAVMYNILAHESTLWKMLNLGKKHNEDSGN